jgi:pyrroline-5-carboxylate reductase
MEGMADSPRVAVLGAGNMGGALVAGMLRVGATQPHRTTATVRTPHKAEALSQRLGIRVTAGGNREAAEAADIVVLAVKPHVLPQVLEEIRWGLREGRILVSMAAAVPLATIEQIVDRPLAIFRAMANTPVTVGEGATAIAANRLATKDDCARIEHIFRSVGSVCYVEEDQLHAVTALSGAGPAYVYTVIEAMVAAGLKAGLPRDIAALLSEQTVLGAAKLVRETGIHPAALRDQVVTPGGVTIEGLYELERQGLRAMFMAAVEAGANRSREITAAVAERLRPNE